MCASPSRLRTHHLHRSARCPEHPQALGPPLAPPPTQLHLCSPHPASVTARGAAGPESSQPPHCTTRLPNCLHSPACECVCIQRESPGGGGGGGKGEGGVHWPGSVRRTHTHSLTFSHSLRARLARAHTRRELRSAQDPERRRKVARAFAPRLLVLEVHLLRGSSELAESCPRRSGPRERRLPPPLLLDLPATSKTIAAAAPSEAPSARRGSGTQAGLRPQDARPA